MLSIFVFSALINWFLASSKFKNFSIFLLSRTLKNNIPCGKIIGSEISPIGVAAILDLNLSEIIFSLTHPKSPP